MRLGGGLALLMSVAGFAAEPCQKCHKLDVASHPLAAPAAHAAARVACAACHGNAAPGKEPHAGLLTRPAMESTCAACHGIRAPGDFRPRGADPFARPTGSPRVVEGELLYERMACAGCHGGSGATRIPEAARFGKALTPEALRFWTSTADDLRRASRCPPILLAPDALEDLEARWKIATSSEGSTAAGASADRGEALVANARCVTCHGLSGRGARRALDLALAGTLFRGRSLASWNDLAPDCPRFRFSPSERQDVASYLLSLARSGGRPSAPVTEGSSADTCIGCHGPDRPDGRPLAPLSFGDARAKVASHESPVSVAPRDADRLAAFLAARPRSAQPEDGTIAQALGKAAPGVACLACHRMGDLGSDFAPDLGIVGRRAKRPWLVSFLMEPTVVRPNIGERMPRFGFTRPEAEALAIVLLGRSSPDPDPPLGEPARGERLYRERGCASCHSFRGRGSTVAPSLDLAAERLHPAFVVDMILTPRKLVPEAVMPATADRRDALDLAAYVLEPPGRD